MATRPCRQCETPSPVDLSTISLVTKIAIGLGSSSWALGHIPPPPCWPRHRSPSADTAMGLGRRPPIPPCWQRHASPSARRTGTIGRPLPPAMLAASRSPSASRSGLWHSGCRRRVGSVTLALSRRLGLGRPHAAAVLAASRSPSAVVTGPRQAAAAAVLNSVALALCHRPWASAAAASPPCWQRRSAASAVGLGIGRRCRRHVLAASRAASAVGCGIGRRCRRHVGSVSVPLQPSPGIGRRCRRHVGSVSAPLPPSRCGIGRSRPPPCCVSVTRQPSAVSLGCGSRCRRHVGSVARRFSRRLDSIGRSRRRHVGSLQPRRAASSSRGLLGRNQFVFATDRYRCGCSRT